MTQNECPNELKKLYRAGRVLPFVGAGVSMSVQWTDAATGDPTSGPSWSGMVEEATRILKFDDPDLLRMRGTDLQILEYFSVKKGGFFELINWMIVRLNASEDSLKNSSIHKALVRLEKCNTFYTTNYDFFLERSFHALGRDNHVIATENDMTFRSPDTEIVKFHGDFNNPDRMVVSERDYHDRMSLSGPMDLKLRSDLFGRAALFIGYSFRDMNISYIFHGLNRQFNNLPQSGSGKRGYIIIHYPSDFEYQLFQRRNMEVIPAYGEDRKKAVTEILEDMSS